MAAPVELAADLGPALRAAAGAGELVLARFGVDQVVTQKGPDQPLTAADLEADRVLHELLTAERPEYGWLSEETVDRPDRLVRPRVWIVDPLDGTRSFVEGRPEFAISIGLSDTGAAVLGVVYNPATGEVYWAVRGDGAYAGRLAAPASEIADQRRIHVSDRAARDQAVLLASRSELAAGEFDPFRDGWRVQPTGSTAYKLAKVAEGAGDVFLSRGPKSEWDVCAGALLVEEAGGRVTDLNGAPLRFNRADPYVHGILAANGRLHDLVLGLVATLPPPPRLRRARDPLHPGWKQE